MPCGADRAILARVTVVMVAQIYVMCCYKILSGNKSGLLDRSVVLLMWEPKSGTAPVPRAVVRGLVFCGALFSLFGLFVGFSDRLFTGGDTLTVLFELLFVSKAELYWSSGEVECFTNLAL